MAEYACASRFVGPSKQRAPAYSAIKKDGVPLHERARRGEEVEVPERDVEAFSVDIQRLDARALAAHLHVGKGYYVRSFARDLARALGTVGHLTGLRRTRSGAFTLERALDGGLLGRAARKEDGAREPFATEVLRLASSLVDAVPGLTRLELTDELVRDARHGKPVRHPDAGAVPEGHACALVARDRLVAIARREGEVVRVVRGFVPDHDAPS